MRGGGRYRSRADADTSWMADAACRDAPTEWFYPTGRDAYDEARALCAECPVMVECRDYAVDHFEMFGFWGGTSNLQRRRIRRNRGLVEAARTDPHRKSIGA